ncbi:MAG: type IV pilus twitching motility protein PilT [Lentisphaeria bacterium]
MSSFGVTLRNILEHGISQNASDWHIREGSGVGIRVKGEIQSIGILADKSLMDSIMENINENVNSSVASKLEETGDADFAFIEPGVGRFRANLHLQRGMRCITLRHVKDKVPSCEQLELPPIILEIARYRDGIVFVTGSTGSGKSTTLACMIEHINENFPRHIITVEDPIEYDFQDMLSIVEQREVGLDTISFDSALRHALRQDPDVIVIGELRSRDSVEAALAAAETGHLVLTTLHTTTAPQAISRLIDFFSHEERLSIMKSLANSLRAVICQRLVPRVMAAGVVPINEIMINTPVVRRLLLDGKIDSLSAAISSSAADGMMTFNNSILDRINEGLISEEIGLSYSSNPDALSMNLKGIFITEGNGIIE